MCWQFLASLALTFEPENYMFDPERVMTKNNQDVLEEYYNLTQNTYNLDPRLMTGADIKLRKKVQRSNAFAKVCHALNPELYKKTR